MYVQTPNERKEDEKNDLVSDNSNIEIPDISTPSLRYKWGNYKVICFSHGKIVYWKKNLFLLPSRQA